MMQDSLMWGMGLGHWFWFALIALVVAALVKYLFFR